MEEHGTEPHHYLDFVHEVAVGDYLEPDPELRALVAALPGRRSIFTNGSRRHALAVLAALGLEGLFEEIFDIVALGFRPKPEPETYRAVLARLGATPARTVLLDDLERNLAPARAIGMRTVLVGAAAPPPAPTSRSARSGSSRRSSRACSPDPRDRSPRGGRMPEPHRSSARAGPLTVQCLDRAAQIFVLTRQRGGRAEAGWCPPHKQPDPQRRRAEKLVPAARAYLPSGKW